MPLVSVIVPVYNVRDYLEKCIRSVQGQSFADWELILVDDGSTDGSGDLARALAASDSRVTVLSRTNGGVGAARNTGLVTARGEYIAFLDGDDAYEPHHLQTLVELCRSSGAQAAASGAILTDEAGTTLGEKLPAAGIYDGSREIFESFLRRGNGLYSCWNKLFLSETILGLRFGPYTRAEDALFCTAALERCTRYAVTDKPTYRYLQRHSSVTNSGFDDRSSDQVRAWTQIADIIRRAAPEQMGFAADKICHDIDRIYMDRRGRPGTREELAFLKSAHIRYYPLRFLPGEMPPRKKAAAALFRISPALYYRLAGL